jgi:ribosome-associated translation inhibitor RaiA
MNIVFCSENNNETDGLQESVIEKLQELHGLDCNISGAQVNFSVEDGLNGAHKVCVIDLAHYGIPISICKSASSYREAVGMALAELTKKITKVGKPMSS